MKSINGFIWGVPTLILILAVGIYLSVRTGFVQITAFPRAISIFIKQFTKKKRKDNGISAYQALCTALAATVGTGNLAGVAGAIIIGGPGAIFWMWICALLGMVTKFAEATLAIRYRTQDSSGEYLGGPMYMIQKGLGPNWTWLSYIYCFLGVVASFGVGNAAQINTVVSSLESTMQLFGMQYSLKISIFLGVILALVIATVLLGGATRIAGAAEKLVPIASLIYILIGMLVLVLRAPAVPAAFASIIRGAFSPRAVTGGVLGSVFVSVRAGASRGVFTNEAGMGTASIAHASAQVEHPAMQGLMGIMEVFIDTIVICTMTALVILCSGVPIPYGNDIGVALTSQAFDSVLGQWMSVVITIILCCFALATVLGWGLYGIRCAQYLFGEGIVKTFAILQGLMVVVGAVLKTETVWLLCEIVNGLMAIPNLIALLALSPELIRLTTEYKQFPAK